MVVWKTRKTGKTGKTGKTLLFEVVVTSYLVQRSIQATAICGMIFCYGHLVTMATEACPDNFTF